MLSVTHNIQSWFYVVLTILSHSIQLLLPRPSCEMTLYWDAMWGTVFPWYFSVRLLSFLSGAYTPLGLRLRLIQLDLIQFPYFQLVLLEQGRWDSVFLHFSLAQTLRREWGVGDSLWTEKLQTDILLSHLASWRHSCSWPPTLFAPVGEGSLPLWCEHFCLLWGRRHLGHVLRDDKQGCGNGGK